MQYRSGLRQLRKPYGGSRQEDRRCRHRDRKLHDAEDDQWSLKKAQDAKAVMKDVLKACKKVEPDCEIEL